MLIRSMLRLCIVMVCMCGGLLYAQNNPLSLTEGKKLKNLKNYRLKDFHLKKKVRYFDLRQYYTTKGYPYMRGWAFDQQAYNKLPSNLRNILGRRDAAKTRNKKGWGWTNRYMGSNGAMQAFRRYGKPYRETISILYFAKLDSNTYIYHQNSKKWMKNFLGEIDTPAELAVVLHTYRGTKRYKKISHGYQVRIDNLVSEKNAPDGRCMHLVRHLIVDTQGEVESLQKGLRNDGPLDKQACDRLRREIAR